MAGTPRGATITLQPGKRTRLLHLVSDSVPQTIRFAAQRTDAAAQADAAPSGEVIVTRRSFFGKHEHRQPLSSENTFRKGMFDVIYSIHAMADQPTTIAFKTRHFRSKWLLVVLLLVLLLGVAAALPAMLAG